MAPPSLHLVGVYDLAAFLLAFILRYENEALTFARVHRLAVVVEALASALTLAAIDSQTSDQGRLGARVGVLCTDRIGDKGDRNCGRQNRSLSACLQFHDTYVAFSFHRIQGITELVFILIVGAHH